MAALAEPAYLIVAGHAADWPHQPTHAATKPFVNKAAKDDRMESQHQVVGGLHRLAGEACVSVLGGRWEQGWRPAVQQHC